MQSCPEGLQPYIKEITSIDIDTQDEESIRKQVSEVVERWARDSSWLTDEFRTCHSDEDDYVLYTEPDGKWLLLLVVWAPGNASSIHNHNTWAVIGCVEGVEHNVSWTRLDDGKSTEPGYAKIEKNKEHTCYPGMVASMPSTAIHSVENRAKPGSVTASLHVYGRDLTKTHRLKFDPENNSCSSMGNLK